MYTLFWLSPSALLKRAAHRVRRRHALLGALRANMDVICPQNVFDQELISSKHEKSRHSAEALAPRRCHRGACAEGARAPLALRASLTGHTRVYVPKNTW